MERKSLDRIFCVSESRGCSVTIGFASLDLTLMQCSMGQMIDTPTLSGLARQIRIDEPDILLVACDAKKLPRDMAHLIDGSFSQLDVHLIPRRFADAKLGLEILSDFGSPEFKIVDQQFYMLAAVSGVFSFLEKCKTEFGRLHSVQFKTVPNDSCLYLDGHSIINLELINSIHDERNGNSLLRTLDHTKTKMGRRFLRMSIIQPLNIIETINVRLSAVSVLIANPIILMKIREHLELISDLQLKIASLSRANTDTLTSLRLIVELKRALESCSNIKDTIKDLNCELLDGIQSAFSNDKTQNILKMIDGVVDILPDGKLNEFQMCHILRAETNPLLDVARRTLQETTDDIIAYSETLISQFNLEGRLKYLNSNRFVLVLSNPTVEQAKLFSKFGNNGYSTLELQKLNERVKESMEEITSLSDSIVKSLCDSINESVGALFVLCEALALLDFVCGLAHYAIEFDCIRPEFTENTEVLINDGLHPFISDPKPVSFSIGGFSRFVIITGANMSGKSTLIRQAALYQIMWQMGSFLPVKSAKMGVYDRIFTRIGSDDDFQSNASTFTLEMRETSVILMNASEKSLVIIDELGRGTSPNEGLALSTAICESLQRSKATVLFVTHFHQVASYMSTFPNIKLMQMSTTDGGAHDIRNGNDAEIRPLSGINLAETLGINQILIGHARDMMRLMRKDSEQEEERMQSLKRAAEKRRIIFRVALQTAKLVREGNLDRNELLAIKEGLMDSLDELDMKNPLQIHIQR